MSRITNNYLIDENGTYTLSDNLKSVFDKCTGNDDNFSKELYKQYRNDETDSICAFYNSFRQENCIALCGADELPINLII